jgi:hypothetical protein
MFKGLKKEFRVWVEKFNQNSDTNFILSFADLELVKVNGKRRKCRILSDELSRRIRETILQGKNNIPSVKFIEFDFNENDNKNTIFSNCPYYCAFEY